MLHRCIRWLQDLSLGVKYFIVMTLVTGITLYGLGYYTYLRSAEQLKTQTVENARLLSSKNNQLLDSYYESIGNLLFSLSTASLDSLPPQQLEDELDRACSSHTSLVKQIYYITPDRQVFGNGQVYYDIMGNQQMMNYFSSTAVNSKYISISPPYHSPRIGRTVGVFYPIYNSQAYRGMLVLELDLDNIQRMIDPQFSSRSQAYFVMDSNANPIFYSEASFLPMDKGASPATLDPDLIAQARHLGLGVNEIQLEGRKYILVSSGYNRFAWASVFVINPRVFYQVNQQFFASFLRSFFAFMVIITVGTFALSMSFTAPLRRFIARLNAIRSVEDCETTIEGDYHGELRDLIQSYNALLGRIHGLMEAIHLSEIRKKNYEQRILQNQINPHFISNTLLCIENLAKQQRIEDVRSAVRSLSKLLTYCFRLNYSITTLQEEIENIRQYTQIQLLRYGPKFALRVDVPPALLGMKVPKLLLQPLVENAIFHGAVCSSGCSLILVQAKEKGAHLVLRVFNSGKGIAAGELAKLRGHLSEERHLLEENNNPEHIGLTNVFARLKLIYGDNCRLSISSSPRRGTLVTITIPLSRES